jgi:type IV pilus assembly protein PilA
MLLQNIRAQVGARLKGDREAGFTLIELLVVMLILGILAAIALPAFFNQKEKAGDAKAKENAHTAQVAVETYATENGGSYSEVTMAKLNKIEPTIPSAAPAKAGEEGIAVTTTAANKYKIESTSSNGHTFSIVNEAGVLTYPCTPKESGGCPASLTWNK